MDGTEIEDDEVLKDLQTEVLLIGDSWEPYQSDNESHTATASTITAPNSPTQASTVSDKSDTSINGFAFDIPYNKLPSSLLTKLQDCQPISNTEVNTVVRTVTDELFQDSKVASRSAYRVVARDLCDKFPQLYDRDADTKELIGTGCHTIFKKIEERVHYLHRPNTKLPKRGDTLLGSRKKSRTIQNLSAGCKEWQPSDPGNMDFETLDSKKDWLKSASAIKDRDELQVESYMNETYAQQRIFLNSTPTVTRIFEEWPVLLEAKYMISQFDRLCALNSSERMEAFQNKPTALNERLKALIGKKIQKCTFQKFNENLQMVATYFNEDITNLYQTHEEPLTRDEVAKLAKVAAPNIVFLDNENLYYMLIERSIVSETSTQSTSLQLLMAAYFNLNMEYPVECQNTLEFMQRYVFKINPKEGTKVRKGRTLNKVLSLMSKLNNI